MPFVWIELDNSDRPFRNIRVERNSAHFEVKPFDFVEYLGGVAVFERPVFELPAFAVGEHGHYSAPILTLQFIYIVDYFELLRGSVFATMQYDLAVFGRVLVLERFSFILGRYISEIRLNKNPMLSGLNPHKQSYLSSCKISKQLNNEIRDVGVFGTIIIGLA